MHAFGVKQTISACVRVPAAALINSRPQPDQTRLAAAAVRIQRDRLNHDEPCDASGLHAGGEPMT